MFGLEANKTNGRKRKKNVSTDSQDIAQLKIDYIDNTKGSQRVNFSCLSLEDDCRNRPVQILPMVMPTEVTSKDNVCSC